MQDDAISLTVDVSTIWEAKMAAIHCHRTQLGESPILAAPEEKQRQFLGTEHFCCAQARLDNDYFAAILSTINS